MKCDELRIENACVYGPGAKVYLAEQVDAAIAELKDKIHQKDFFWDGCGFSKMGFKNTIAVANYVEELKADNESLGRAVSNWHDKYCNLQETIDGLECKLECVKADKDKELRATKRALWLARAESAKNAMCRYYRLAQKEECDPQPHGWSCYINGEVYSTGKMNRKLEPHYWFDVWEEVERKCRAKAEEYK